MCHSNFNRGLFLTFIGVVLTLCGCSTHAVRINSADLGLKKEIKKPISREILEKINFKDINKKEAGNQVFKKKDDIAKLKSTSLYQISSNPQPEKKIDKQFMLTKKNTPSVFSSSNIYKEKKITEKFSFQNKLETLHPKEISLLPYSMKVKIHPEASTRNSFVSEKNVSGFILPANGPVLNKFGYKVNGIRSEGIDIFVPYGTKIKASDSGVVIYAGSGLKNLGNMILIRHANKFVTVYAQNSQLMVVRGEHVKKGQIIALSGRSVTSNQEQLHFEIRRNSAPIDPGRFLKF